MIRLVTGGVSNGSIVFSHVFMCCGVMSERMDTALVEFRSEVHGSEKAATTAQVTRVAISGFIFAGFLRMCEVNNRLCPHVSQGLAAPRSSKPAWVACAKLERTTEHGLQIIRRSANIKWPSMGQKRWKNGRFRIPETLGVERRQDAPDTDGYDAEGTQS
eukprot:1368421-Amorphochlora_amoeboformis.AAC.1